MAVVWAASYSSDSTPSLGTFLWPYAALKDHKKKKKKKKEKKKENKLGGG